ncbi:MAG: DivIVA protein [Mycobacterium sp.]|jgi:DivIVA domain-containing protein|nr:DivIVA protein [Mycobacterium sp.]
MRDDLTAFEVRDILFGSPLTRKRGYNEDEVDAFLDDVEATIAKLDRRG